MQHAAMIDGGKLYETYLWGESDPWRPRAAAARCDAERSGARREARCRSRRVRYARLTDSASDTDESLHNQILFAKIVLNKNIPFSTSQRVLRTNIPKPHKYTYTSLVRRTKVTARYKISRFYLLPYKSELLYLLSKIQNLLYLSSFIG